MSGPGPHADERDSRWQRAASGNLTTTVDGTITDANDTMGALVGLDRAALVGRRFMDLLSVGGRIYHDTHIGPMLAMGGRVESLALELVRADGSRLAALVSAVVDPGVDGAPDQIRVAVLEATDRRRYEEELLRTRAAAEVAAADALRLAQALQRTLIPPRPPAIDGLELAAAYRPAGDGREVGGDFYDVFPVGAGDWVVAVGDVCGKGVEAAIVTAAARHEIRSAAVRHDAPSEVLRQVDAALRPLVAGRFCTVVLVRLQRRQGRWVARTATGGHPLPLLDRDGRSQHVGRYGSLLGILPEVSLHDTEVALRPGDTLVLYTDGVTEGRRGSELFGDEGLQASVAAHRGSAAGTVAGLLGDVTAYQGDRTSDDIVVVAVRVP